jgi:hypothetical protein
MPTKPKSDVRAQLKALTCKANVSFAKDIAPMFTAQDIAHMKSVTQGSLILNNYTSAKTWAHQIYSEVSQHYMPPPQSGESWSQAQIDLFGCWIQQGCKP